MNTNGHPLVDRTAPASQVGPVATYRDRGTWLGLCSAFLQAVTVLILGWLVAPALWDVATSQERAAMVLTAREADSITYAGQAEAMRVRAITQQADLAAAQERTRQIASDNLRLAEEINRRLRGD